MKKNKDENRQWAYLESLLKQAKESCEKNHRLCEEIARLCAEAQECARQQEYSTGRLIVDARLVSIVIKLLACFIRKGWIRAEKNNSVRNIARLIGEKFSFCRKGHTNKYLKGSTVVSYMKSEMAAEEYRQPSVELLEEIYKWLGEEIKALKKDG